MQQTLHRQWRLLIVTTMVTMVVTMFFACTGPQGDLGPRGASGEQGAQGERGAQGPQGEQGLTGEKGDIGAAGAVGPMGDQGPMGGIPGPVGPRGPQGDGGPTGPEGARGATGLQGNRGSPGAEGAAGSTGERGLPGDKGEKGDAGLQGPQGEPGQVHSNSVVVIPLPEKYEIEGIEDTYTFTLMDADTAEPYYDVSPGPWQIYPPHMSNPIRTRSLQCSPESWFASTRGGGRSACDAERERLSRSVVGWIEG